MGAPISRARVLQRLALAVGGTAGLGGGVAAARRVDDRRGTTLRRTLTLYGRDLRVAGGSATGRRRSTAVPSGDLLDAGLQPVGRLTGSALADGGTELHSFALAEGTIFGLALAGAQGGQHAVVGGTGTFAGAAGTYEIAPAPELPGRSARFTFDLDALEG